MVEASPLIKKMYLNVEKEWKPTILTLSFPDVTVRYIKKMHELCQKRGVKMHFISPPLAESDERKEVEAVLKEEYEKSDGSVGVRLYVKEVKTVQEIKDGNFKIPELKVLKNRPSAPVNNGFTEVDTGDDLPF